MVRPAVVRSPQQISYTSSSDNEYPSFSNVVANGVASSRSLKGNPILVPNIKSPTAAFAGIEKNIVNKILIVRKIRYVHFLYFWFLDHSLFYLLPKVIFQSCGVAILHRILLNKRILV